MSKIIKHTKDWVEQFVIAYNLCPFATKPFRRDRIRYVHFQDDNAAPFLELLLKEALALREQTPEDLETTLVVHPKLTNSFEDYLDLFATVEDLFEEQGFSELIQVASFHPDYQFADTEYEAPENFTNRSPYPMIHLLRVDSVAHAIDTYPDTARIPTINIARLKQIGSSELIKRYHEIIGKN